jgi:hypothetical protein
MHAGLYTRQADGSWVLTGANRPEDSLVLESVEATLTLADLYGKVEFGMSAPSARSFG